MLESFVRLQNEVFVSTIDIRGHLREKCRDILAGIVNNEIDGNIDVEVLQELLYVYSSRGEREKGLIIVEDMLNLFPGPYAIKKDAIEKAKELMKKYNTLVARDAIHCAVTIMYGLEGIISADKDLKSVKEIHCFPP